MVEERAGIPSICKAYPKEMATDSVDECKNADSALPDQELSSRRLAQVSTVSCKIGICVQQQSALLQRVTHRAALAMGLGALDVRNKMAQPLVASSCPTSDLASEGADCEEKNRPARSSAVHNLHRFC